MVNNFNGNNGIGEIAVSSSSDDNEISNLSIGCDANIDINIEDTSKSYVRRRKCNEKVQICEKTKKRESHRKISTILRKNEADRTVDEVKQLETNADIVRQINKRRENVANTRERILEKEDPIEVIKEKARNLADVLSRAQHLVCYTGAGISTSARIPDYRGSKGIWTLLQQGKEIGEHDLSLAEPTFTHMALYELHRRNILRYTLSQNCDGLHLRSGIPRKLLSEVHGNMYVEVCKHCKPNVEYWRLFDTTELTARYNHSTNRRCHFCFKPLIDTIVHFGERGRLKWPLNWENACKNAEKADVILCLGSSLKVLKKYSWLWQMDRPKSKRPKIYIVNLQWTPKDKNASLKINGKCDEVMKLVMDYMNVNVAPYNRAKDPIFAHASILAPEEMHTVTQPMLKHSADVIKNEKTDTDVEILSESTIAVKNEANIENEESIKDEIIYIDDDSNESKDEEFTSTSSTSEGHILNQKQPINDTNQTEYSSTYKIDDLKDCSHNAKCVSNVDESNKSHETIDQTQQLNCNTYIKMEQSNLQVKANIPIKMEVGESSESKIQNKDYLRRLINYYKAIDGVVPHWYDINYAYSGLHSIIHPPPNEVDIWSTIIIPIYKLNRNAAECGFCFDNYAEDKCQFYKSYAEFHVASIRQRNGNRILCECCDHDDEIIDVDEETTSDDIDGSEGPKTNSEEDDLENNTMKRQKIEKPKEKPQRTVQPGWYGKGYKKTIKRKKTRRSNL